ncbi:leucyl-tRNA synthetase [Candidatus Phytoplasma oryzae]|uniref:Leucine--tRNA ligase n=1 Tax=Candidatus Phytoplasma oryzae TaxID=203274 RepID=A0A328IIG7_9MOLU|nr:leucine--tRNA ligase [Candidatus Phytoplasma oryzae]RAM57791.1 leucyl-tRNA synthetase [Candidatus Phytoplasma oryzae]
MLIYNFKKIESKWQEYWKKKKTFQTNDDFSKKKFYCLDMFPYPSSEGLHVGHIKGYTASDIISRFKRMQGYNVLHPFGWDSFGLPAEQYALTTGKNPQKFTYENIYKFKKQIESLGKGIDWSKELATSDEYFYQWTQWIFKKLYEKGLAFIQDVEVNFCKKLGTVLANEEIIQNDEGIFSERGHFPVVKKKMKQWVLKITDYADRLLDDLNILDWKSEIKEIQRKWIGKKEGFIFEFPILLDKYEKKNDNNNYNKFIKVFTTKPSTIFGINAVILSPEHPLVLFVTSQENKIQVKNYLKKTVRKSVLERQINKEKTGVFTGSYVLHPFNNEKIPIWISDYVLMHFGTGAVMCVPSCDMRDFDFSIKMNLKLVNILKNDNLIHFLKKEKKDYFNKANDFRNSILINSSFLNGLTLAEAERKIIKFSKIKKNGYIYSTYQMHDWVFSRQRYWGEPFPVFYDENDNVYLEKDEDLPLKLPFLDKIEISGDGKSPLSKAFFWLYFEKDGKKYKRDSNTMPQVAGSSWYYIGYILKNYLGIIPLNTEEAKKKLDYFLPVDIYIGGKEHTVGHLLYSRFWHKFLYDLGLVSTKEPFKKLVNQGMILGKDNLKMSKSKKNSINASLVLDKYGADVLRMYIMFLGPLEDDKIWTENGLKGIQRFLNRIYKIFSLSYISEVDFLPLNSILYQTVQKVTNYYDILKFNKVISELMIFVNKVYKWKKISNKQMKIFLQLLNPISPHITEELNFYFLANKEVLVNSRWPYNSTYELSNLNSNKTKIIVQVDGKFKINLFIDKNEKKSVLLKKILDNDKINLLMKDREIIKVIYVQNKLFNLVTKLKNDLVEYEKDKFKKGNT